MPPISKLDIWANEDRSSVLNVDCFLPTGILITLPTIVTSTIADIKYTLWREASSYPLFNILKDSSSYVFVCVNQKGKQEEIVDESRQLCEVKPFRPLLKCVERKGDREEKLLDSKIGYLIGKSLEEFDQLEKMEQEVMDFRRKYRVTAETELRERGQLAWESRALYMYPPEIAENFRQDHFFRNFDDKVFLNVAVCPEVGDTKQVIKVHAGAYPSDVVSLALSKRRKLLNLQEVENVQDYLLKIIGKESYLLGEHPILEYSYIRSCLLRNYHPCLSLVPRASLKLEELRDMSQKNSGPPPLPPKWPAKVESLSLWNIVDRKLSIKIVCANNVNAGETMKLSVRGGIYHGSEILCDIISTDPANGINPVWHQYLNFDLAVCDIPRMARLCLVIYGILDAKADLKATKKKNKRKESLSLAWVNTTLFDYKDCLRMGTLKLHAWPVEEALDDLLNPIGAPVSNINTSTSPCLVIEFQKFANPVKYPPLDKVVELAAQVAEEKGIPTAVHDSDPQVDQLRQIVEREPLAPIFDQDKEFVWRMRLGCHEKFSYGLSKLLCSTKWGCKEDVAQMQTLLTSWPDLDPEQALELLDFTYADKCVREFGVKCLEKLSDTELEHYLLQLVQVLKYESYLDCALARFLLKRGLQNQRIGHALFWHLRAEMHLPEVSVRFGLLLEAYCRGSVSHLKSLSKQLEAMNKLRATTDFLQSMNPKELNVNREGALLVMRQCLGQQTYLEALSDVHSPLDPSLRLGNLKIEKCKFMDSKMRPLWLVFENFDHLGSDVYFIFKNGDDLRQDMLTLQILRLMDKLWQSENLDLGLIPYGCLSTGRKTGLIEIVLNAETIANIQKSKKGVAMGAFTKTVLLDWLRDNNPDAESLNKAIEMFTLSCAGYCVATFVLGVGDRHSDNIMIRKNGQLFHIDFGHFLGNFKSKFGVRRERVPFVLTMDFIHIITKGRIDNDDCEEFSRFRRICESAYLSLRRKGHLLLSLFAMMLCSGIPELRNMDDINYIRKTLALGKSDEEALKYFRKNFQEAKRNSWKTSLNWAAHNFARDNR